MTFVCLLALILRAAHDRPCILSACNSLEGGEGGDLEALTSGLDMINELAKLGDHILNGDMLPVTKNRPLNLIILHSLHLKF